VEKRLNISLRELAVVAATRGAIGVGIGLLLSNALSREKRKAIGLPLFILGALSSIPIAMHLFHKKNEWTFSHLGD
jgi:hypothetical protein